MVALAAKARKLLKKNLKKGTTTLYGKTADYEFTCPSIKRYPHQWLWDSSFHAIVLSHLDTERGQREIETLLKGQREDGFLPIVIHWEGVSPAEWVFTFPYRSEKVQLITQPPVVALAVEKLYEKTGDREFLKRVLPGLMRFADYLNICRDFDGDGLVSNIHAWETGMDMLPAYDGPAGITSDRPNDAETFSSLLVVAWKYYMMGWEEKAIAGSAIFDVEDVAFNCIHAQSQRSIARMLDATGDQRAADYHAGAERTELAIIASCRNPDGLFYSLDRDNTQLKVKTVASLFPLILDSIPKEMLDGLVEHLTDPEEFWPRYPVPTVALDEPTFNPGESHALWRGPTWISTNWFLIRGLEKHGYTDIASELKERTLELVEKNGFREYYNPFTGEGYGQKDFGWATLAVDLQEE